MSGKGDPNGRRSCNWWRSNDLVCGPVYIEETNIWSVVQSLVHTGLMLRRDNFPIFCQEPVIEAKLIMLKGIHMYKKSV